MRTFLATLLVLFLSVPTAMAGSLAGKGLWCPVIGDETNELHRGYWFHNGGVEDRVFSYRIAGHDIAISHTVYREPGTSKIEIGSFIVIDRETLQKTDPERTVQCYRINSQPEIYQKLQDIIDAAKAKNKL